MWERYFFLNVYYEISLEYKDIKMVLGSWHASKSIRERHLNRILGSRGHLLKVDLAVLVDLISNQLQNSLDSDGCKFSAENIVFAWGQGSNPTPSWKSFTDLHAPLLEISYWLDAATHWTDQICYNTEIDSWTSRTAMTVNYWLSS